MEVFHVDNGHFMWFIKYLKVLWLRKLTHQVRIVARRGCTLEAVCGELQRASTSRLLQAGQAARNGPEIRVFELAESR